MDAWDIQKISMCHRTISIPPACTYMCGMVVLLMYNILSCADSKNRRENLMLFQHKFYFIMIATHIIIFRKVFGSFFQFFFIIIFKTVYELIFKEWE